MIMIMIIIIILHRSLQLARVDHAGAIGIKEVEGLLYLVDLILI